MNTIGLTYANINFKDLLGLVGFKFFMQKSNKIQNRTINSL